MRAVLVRKERGLTICLIIQSASQPATLYILIYAFVQEIGICRPYRAMTTLHRYHTPLSTSLRSVITSCVALSREPPDRPISRHREPWYILGSGWDRRRCVKSRIGEHSGPVIRGFHAPGGGDGPFDRIGQSRASLKFIKHSSSAHRRP